MNGVVIGSLAIAKIATFKLNQSDLGLSVFSRATSILIQIIEPWFYIILPTKGLSSNVESFCIVKEVRCCYPLSMLKFILYLKSGLLPSFLQIICIRYFYKNLSNTLVFLGIISLYVVDHLCNIRLFASSTILRLLGKNIKNISFSPAPQHEVNKHALRAHIQL